MPKERGCPHVWQMDAVARDAKTEGFKWKFPPQFGSRIKQKSCMEGDETGEN